ncbi:MAG: glycoside hydrolase family 57 protein [Candidatus Margulisbacteria bacterium]|jgi:alpha-amylase|nr:glycoside hydrolase family 57 protein [Candidatus Margulisiibacteriota bacterium]
MPAKLCLYFQVHQPFRLKKYTIFSAERDQYYFDDEKNRQIIQSIAADCYLPANKLLLELIKKYKGRFKVAYSITGTAVEQFQKYAPEVLASFRALALTGCVEFLSETYYHSLSALYSKTEFIEQVEKHREMLLEQFDYEPKTFRNTELIYDNEIARMAEALGYEVILAEGVEHILGWRSPNYVYQPAGAGKIKLLLRNCKLSDDLAFRYNNRLWPDYPLTPAKYLRWIEQLGDAAVNIFVDYETFGEHIKRAENIFEFLHGFIKEAAQSEKIEFITPVEAARFKPAGEIDIPAATSWADTQKDLSAWLGNNMQKDAAQNLYALEKEIKKTKNKILLNDWKRLTSADHLYYISTKYLGDGEVHGYFSPYKSPYDAFINYMNVLENVRKRLKLLANAAGREDKRVVVKKTKKGVKKMVAKKKTKKAAKKPAKKKAKKRK